MTPVNKDKITKLSQMWQLLPPKNEVDMNLFVPIFLVKIQICYLKKKNNENTIIFKKIIKSELLIFSHST